MLSVAYISLAIACWAGIVRRTDLPRAYAVGTTDLLIVGFYTLPLTTDLAPAFDNFLPHTGRTLFSFSHDSLLQIVANGIAVFCRRKINLYLKKSTGWMQQVGDVLLQSVGEASVESGSFVILRLVGVGRLGQEGDETGTLKGDVLLMIVQPEKGEAQKDPMASHPLPHQSPERQVLRPW